MKQVGRLRYSAGMEVPLENMSAYADKFVLTLPTGAGERAHVVGLSGELGAGKTTFVQHVAKALGVEEQIISPTFVIAQRYQTAHPVFTSLVHIDAYRLSDDAKDTIGFVEYLGDPHNLVLVEWPENLPKEAGFPADAPVLKFETVDETTRFISPK